VTFLDFDDDAEPSCNVSDESRISDVQPESMACFQDGMDHLVILLDEFSISPEESGIIL
jgi:hypothetical protein